MNNNLLVIKEDKRIPDFYTVIVKFITGDEATYEAVSHCYPLNNLIFEIREKKEEIIQMPLANIQKITFKKDFINLIELSKEKDKCQKI